MGTLLRPQPSVPHQVHRASLATGKTLGYLGPFLLPSSSLRLSPAPSLQPGPPQALVIPQRHRTTYVLHGAHDALPPGHRPATSSTPGRLAGGADAHVALRGSTTLPPPWRPPCPVPPVTSSPRDAGFARVHPPYPHSLQTECQLHAAGRMRLNFGIFGKYICLIF